MLYWLSLLPFVCFVFSLVSFYLAFVVAPSSIQPKIDVNSHGLQFPMALSPEYINQPTNQPTNGKKTYNQNLKIQQNI